MKPCYLSVQKMISLEMYAHIRESQHLWCNDNESCFIDFFVLEWILSLFYLVEVSATILVILFNLSMNIDDIKTTQGILNVTETYLIYYWYA